MKLLHTSDWHVGKTIRGHSRAGEHEAVLAEIAGIAAEHAVDLVIIAGDLFDTASPTAESERIVYRALLALRATGARVVIVAGNHDNQHRLAAIAPMLRAIDVVLAPHVVRPEEGGVVEITGRSTERVRLALVPFLSQRGIVRADDLMAGDAVGQLQKYADRYRTIVHALCAPLKDDLVNIVVAHTYVERALSGGGERAAHVGGDYAVAASVFPAHVHYVALGHLHRPQRIEGATQIHYCGSPLQLDFGEVDQAKQVNIVEVTLGAPAKVTAVALSEGRNLRTVRATLADLRDIADEMNDSWVRVELLERGRAGIGDEVRGLIPTAVDVLTVQDVAHDRLRVQRDRRAKSPLELFRQFCDERGYDDPRVRELFAELYEDANATGSD